MDPTLIVAVAALVSSVSVPLVLVWYISLGAEKVASTLRIADRDRAALAAETHADTTARLDHIKWLVERSENVSLDEQAGADAVVDDTQLRDV